MGRSWNGRINLSVFPEDKRSFNLWKETRKREFKLKKLSDHEAFSLLMLKGNIIIINDYNKKLKEIKQKLQI